MSRRFQYSEDSPLAGANEELDALWRRIEALERENEIQFDATVGTEVTTIGHTLGRKPSRVAVLPHGDARVWIIDKLETTIKLRASAAVKATITLKG